MTDHEHSRSSVVSVDKERVSAWLQAVGGASDVILQQTKVITRTLHNYHSTRRGQGSMLLCTEHDRHTKLSTVNQFLWKLVFTTGIEV